MDDALVSIALIAQSIAALILIISTYILIYSFDWRLALALLCWTQSRFIGRKCIKQLKKLENDTHD